MCTRTHVNICRIEILRSGKSRMLTGDQVSWFNCPGLFKVNTTLALLIIELITFPGQGSEKLETVSLFYINLISAVTYSLCECTWVI